MSNKTDIFTRRIILQIKKIKTKKIICKNIIFIQIHIPSILSKTKLNEKV